ncbi:uncharacterized protein BDZ99DRAFT_471641 [Mytilinidion resinicola]|uniref:Zn(2)-C6 fungal-type domain-containing protein n=1 Tax=Mytilinidion resinicola TaxID=574789 RepID=A0A6A6Z7X0_9PEZI|nr:uncharacterized protein BDZ99DRAFT_471641 [Mytilinidion resinicola]KAF2816414.1 hypothetical protein BDZ99DRAFT_471641 [Mytilinidion resinicola]
MNSAPRPRQRRRLILTCVECRKRKQKCDRGQPCAQCIARGPESICIYEKFKSPSNAVARASSKSTESSPGQIQDRTSPSILQNAQEYGYSESDAFSSMGMLTKVISGIDEIPPSHRPAAPQIRSKLRADYFGYVRRLPAKTNCDILIDLFFKDVNHLNEALDQVIFREQLDRWWATAHDTIFKQGPDALPLDLWYFPALIFQVLGVALQFLPTPHDPQLEELKFTPLQTFTELSKEYSDCGEGLSNLVGRPSPTLVAIQSSFMKDLWYANAGDILQAWNHSGRTVKEAISVGLHLEPELPSSSKPDELLDALWMNELRKRTWWNMFVWDSFMALELGRPMFIDINKCTVTPPIECEIPQDRLKRVPTPRSDSDRPIALTERILRLKISRRFAEIRELESQGSVPQNPEKVKELHDFAVKYREDLPTFYRNINPDTSWDELCPFVPTHRELISFLTDSFLMALHRPYIFTRSKSQREVYNCALAILDSQDRLFQFHRSSSTQWFIGTTFPTFDAAVLLAVVLVSNPERYHATFSRPYQSLQRALERLQAIGPSLPLAKTGSEILHSTIRRVIEAHERAGPSIIGTELQMPSTLEDQYEAHSAQFTRVSPDAEPWHFEVKPSEMDWTGQNPELFDFDFSNLEVPMPLKELLLDEGMAAMSTDMDVYNPSLWPQPQGHLGQTDIPLEQPEMMNVADNSLWNFLAGYPTSFEDGNL